MQSESHPIMGYTLKLHPRKWHAYLLQPLNMGVKTFSG